MLPWLWLFSCGFAPLTCRQNSQALVGAGQDIHRQTAQCHHCLPALSLPVRTRPPRGYLAQVVSRGGSSHVWHVSRTRSLISYLCSSCLVSVNTIFDNYYWSKIIPWTWRYIGILLLLYVKVLLFYLTHCFVIRLWLSLAKGNTRGHPSRPEANRETPGGTSLGLGKTPCFVSVTIVSISVEYIN